MTPVIQGTLASVGLIVLLALCARWGVEMFARVRKADMSHGDAQPSAEDVIYHLREGLVPARLRNARGESNAVEEYWISTLGVWVRFDCLPCIIGAYPNSGYRYLTHMQARRLRREIYAALNAANGRISKV